MLPAGSPMISIKKVVDMTNSKAFGRITDVVTMNIKGCYQGAIHCGQNSKPHGQDGGRDDNVDQNHNDLNKKCESSQQ